MNRVAKIIRLKPECREEYEHYHKNIWPEVAANLKTVGIRNYSIHYYNGLLFSYFEYTGDDFERDMARLASFPANVRWRKIMSRMQEPMTLGEPPGTWTEMDEVFYQE
ncbi:MAG: L-rhamnose mutarotase [Spirochaetales bacterium]|nr:L-rhamnose mutarotase [Spirochaetales bacterium]